MTHAKLVVLCERDDVERGYFPVENAEQYVPATAILTLQSQLEEALERAEKAELRHDELAVSAGNQFRALVEMETRAQTAESEVVKLRAALEPFADAAPIGRDEQWLT